MGAGLLAKAAGQAALMWLTHRLREQARSLRVCVGSTLSWEPVQGFTAALEPSDQVIRQHLGAFR